MGKKATLAADNVFCTARYKKAEISESYNSREGASQLLNIDRTRLANIELGKIDPYPEEVVTMAEKYNAPELCNYYCANTCPLGKTTVNQLTLDDLDRLMLKVLGSLKGIEELRTRLITIAEDGQITKEETMDFNYIIQELKNVSDNAQTLDLWARKNLETINK